MLGIVFHRPLGARSSCTHNRLRGPDPDLLPPPSEPLVANAVGYSSPDRDGLLIPPTINYGSGGSEEAETWENSRRLRLNAAADLLIPPRLTF